MHQKVSNTIPHGYKVCDLTAYLCVMPHMHSLNSVCRLYMLISTGELSNNYWLVSVRINDLTNDTFQHLEYPH